MHRVVVRYSNLHRVSRVGRSQQLPPWNWSTYLLRGKLHGPSSAGSPFATTRAKKPLKPPGALRLVGGGGGTVELEEKPWKAAGDT